MKLDAAVTQVMQMEACFRGIIARAKRESWTHGRILEERKKLIQDHPNWPRLPAWAQSNVLRFSSGALAVLDVTCVHWQHRLDGAPVERDAIPSGRWGDVEGCYVWTHSGECFLARDTDVSGGIHRLAAS